MTLLVIAMFIKPLGCLNIVELAIQNSSVLIDYDIELVLTMPLHIYHNNY